MVWLSKRMKKVINKRRYFENVLEEIVKGRLQQNKGTLKRRPQMLSDDVLSLWVAEI